MGAMYLKPLPQVSLAKGTTVVVDVMVSQICCKGVAARKESGSKWGTFLKHKHSKQSGSQKNGDRPNRLNRLFRIINAILKNIFTHIYPEDILYTEMPTTTL